MLFKELNILAEVKNNKRIIGEVMHKRLNVKKN